MASERAWSKRDCDRSLHGAALFRPAGHRYSAAMEPQREPLWGWPGISNLLYAYLWLGVPSFAWFALVYAGADYWTGLHQYRVPLYGEWEHRIPFVPAMAIFYNSLHVSNAIAPFALRTRPEMHALATVWFLMTFVGGVIFLLLPFEPVYARPSSEDLGACEGLYKFA